MSDSNRLYGYACLHKLTNPDTHVWISCGAIIAVEPNFPTREEQRVLKDPYAPNGSKISISGGVVLYVKEKPDEVAAAITEALTIHYGGYIPINEDDMSDVQGGACI